jgi:hypothetical protein
MVDLLDLDLVTAPEEFREALAAACVAMRALAKVMARIPKPEVVIPAVGEEGEGVDEEEEP